MLNFVLGPSGAGKTKWLIDKANEEISILLIQMILIFLA